MVLWSDATLGFVPVVLFLTASVVFWAVVLCWQIRADDKGIAIRRCLSWDFWSWDDFENGRIFRSTEPDGFVRFSSDMSVKRLPFSGLSRDDRKILMALCLNLWKPPDLADMPAELRLLFPRFVPRFLQSQIVLSSEGLRLIRGNKERVYCWNDVHKVTLGRSTHQHTNFRFLSIVLADRTIRLASSSGLGHPWTGCVPEWVVKMLTQYVPEDKRESFVFHEPPTSRDEVEAFLRYREESLAATQKDMPYLMVFFVLPVVSFPLVKILCDCHRRTVAFPTCAIFYLSILVALTGGVLFLLVPWEHRRVLARERARLEQLLLWMGSENKGEESGSDTPVT